VPLYNKANTFLGFLAYDMVSKTQERRAGVSRFLVRNVRDKLAARQRITSYISFLQSFDFIDSFLKEKKTKDARYC
jgi:hypothetical protein